MQRTQCLRDRLTTAESPDVQANPAPFALPRLMTESYEVRRQHDHQVRRYMRIAAKRKLVPIPVNVIERHCRILIDET